MWVCSGTHSDSKPRASSAWASGAGRIDSAVKNITAPIFIFPPHMWLDSVGKPQAPDLVFERSQGDHHEGPLLHRRGDCACGLGGRMRRPLLCLLVSALRLLAGLLLSVELQLLPFGLQLLPFGLQLLLHALLLSAQLRLPR